MKGLGGNPDSVSGGDLGAAIRVISREVMDGAGLASLSSLATPDIDSLRKALRDCANECAKILHQRDGQSAADGVCHVLGHSIDGELRGALDRSFSFVDITDSGNPSYVMKRGVVPRQVIEELDRVNRRLHRQTLLPAPDTVRWIPEYESPLAGAYARVAVLAVPGSENLDANQTRESIGNYGLLLSDRLNSILSLNITLALTGVNALRDDVELRDEVGGLYALSRGIHSHDGESSFIIAHPRLRALARMRDW